MNYDIFRDELATKYSTYGHALWEPRPGGNYTAVDIGDVGFIREGRFHRLFNVLLPGDDPSHQDGVPQCHEPLVLRTRQPIDTSTLWPNDLRSNGVLDRTEERRRGAREPDGATQVSFSCSRRRGAILSLPTPALRKDTTARGAFAKCIIKHIDEWFAFARERGLGISREDIILVTGCHLTRTWATIAFQEEGEHISFGAQVFGVSDVMWRFTPEGAQGVAYNLGPSGQNLPENQCIFIRGFRVARFSVIPPRLRGAAGPAQLPDEDYTNPDMRLDSIPNETHYQDPLRTVLEYIITVGPDCDMALIHDDDLQYVDTASLESLRPDSMMSYLQGSAPKIWQLSCGVLHKDTSPTSHSDEGASNSELLSQITVAALSKFDMAHELKPVTTRNMTQEGDESLNHNTQFTSPIHPRIMNQSRGPMKMVEHADELMQYAEILLRDHQAIIRHDDRILIEDRMAVAREYRYGTEQKQWLARAEQAKLYFERAQITLDTVKWAVDNAIEIRSRRGGF